MKAEKAGSLRWNDSKRCWQVRLALPPGAVVEWVDLPADIGRKDIARAKAAAKVVKKADARIDRLGKATRSRRWRAEQGQVSMNDPRRARPKRSAATWSVAPGRGA